MVHAHARKARELRRQQLAEHFSMRADRVQSDVFDKPHALTQRADARHIVRSGLSCVGREFRHGRAFGKAPRPARKKRPQRMPTYENTCPLRPVERLVPRHAQKRCVKLSQRHRQNPGRL